MPTAPDPLGLAGAKAFDGWVADSRRLARQDVYLRGALEPGASPASAIVLTPTYFSRARAVTTIQLALAGHRIAALLLGLRISTDRDGR